MSYRSVQTASHNDERVHSWSWKQRISELYREKLNYFLRQELICQREITGSEWFRRLNEVKELLREEDWDDVSMNRASMGYCGWIQCGEPPAKTRSLSILQLILTSDMDRDVIDSFHSVKCFRDFQNIRLLLTRVPLNLRTLPDSLRREYDEQFFGGEVSRDERLVSPSRIVRGKPKETLVESLGGERGASSPPELKSLRNPGDEDGQSSVGVEREHGDTEFNCQSPAGIEPRPTAPFRIVSHGKTPLGYDSTPPGYRAVVVERDKGSMKSHLSSRWTCPTRSQLEEKEWMYFRPEKNLLSELGIKDEDHGEEEDPSRVENSELLLFEYQRHHQETTSGSESPNPLSLSSSGGSGLLVSSLKKVDKSEKLRKSVSWAEQLEHSLDEDGVCTDQLDESLRYFADLRELFEVSEEESDEGDEDEDTET